MQQECVIMNLRRRILTQILSLCIRLFIIAFPKAINVVETSFSKNVKTLCQYMIEGESFGL